jgi:hypothetical protein
MLNERGKPVWSADIGVHGDLRNVVGEKAACPFRWPGQVISPEETSRQTGSGSGIGLKTTVPSSSISGTTLLGRGYGQFYGVERRSLYGNWAGSGVTFVQHDRWF